MLRITDVVKHLILINIIMFIGSMTILGDVPQEVFVDLVNKAYKGLNGTPSLCPICDKTVSNVDQATNTDAQPIIICDSSVSFVETVEVGTNTDPVCPDITFLDMDISDCDLPTNTSLINFLLDVDNYDVERENCPKEPDSNT